MEWRSYLPQIIMAGGGLTVLLVDLFSSPGTRTGSRRANPRLLAAIAVAFAALAGLAAWLPGVGADRFGTYFVCFFAAVVAVVSLLAVDYLEQRTLPVAEFYALMCLAATGMMILGVTRNLLTVYLGLELMSQSSYALAGLARREPASSEAALKYFLMGSLASAVAVFGIIFMYGSSGSFELSEVGRWAKAGGIGTGLIPAWSGAAGLVFFLAGVGLKVAAVPFHMWVPDAYEGAPNPVTAFFAVGPKAAGLAVLVRVVLTAFPTVRLEASTVFALVSAATMTLGNLSALGQVNVKRMLAYSSVAQAGYLLAVLAIPSQASVKAFLFYLAAYAAATLGIFTLVSWRGTTHPDNLLTDYRGLGRTHPALAAVMTYCLLSLVGVPPTGGFMGKLYLFGAAVENGRIWFALILVANGVLSVPYYYGLLRQMYFPPAGTNGAEPLIGSTERLGFTAALALVLAVGSVALIGLAPEALFRWTAVAGQPLLH